MLSSGKDHQTHAFLSRCAYVWAVLPTSLKTRPPLQVVCPDMTHAKQRQRIRKFVFVCVFDLTLHYSPIDCGRWRIWHFIQERLSLVTASTFELKNKIKRRITISKCGTRF